MSQQELAAKSRNLAQELIASSESFHHEEFPLVNNNQQTGETIVVIAIRVSKPDEVNAITKFATKMATQPYGKPCTCCNGSGRA